MGQLPLLLLLLRQLCLMALSGSASAFGTINMPAIGQHNEHEMVTRLAFQCPQGGKSDGFCFEPRSLDQLAGYHVDLFGVPIPGGGFNGAVGAPDTLDPAPEGPEAHCDDADFLDIPDYPQSRTDATSALQACVDHLRSRVHQAIGAAGRLLNSEGRIQSDMVDLSGTLGGDCTFAFPSLQVNEYGRAKCNVLEGFGRALHVVQDFYSHSNWADTADKSRPISRVNPPGLGRTDLALFLTNFSGDGHIPPEQVPLDLTTGCFTIPDGTPGSGYCAGRITHHTMTKDYGIILLNGTFGDVGPGAPRAESTPENFQLAVEAAARASREAWRSFQDELRRRYGNEMGDMMICSLVRDNPVSDCRARAIAVVLDSNLPQLTKDRVAQRMDASSSSSEATAFKLIEFGKGTHASVKADPVSSAPNPVQAVQGSYDIREVFDRAIDMIVSAIPDNRDHRGTIVLLTATSSQLRHISAQVKRAYNSGVRLHWGHLGAVHLLKKEAVNTHWLDQTSIGDLITDVVTSGGTFSVLDPTTVGVVESFVDAALRRKAGSSGGDVTDTLTVLSPGKVVVDMVSRGFPVKYFLYSAAAGERVTFTVGSFLGGRLQPGSCSSMVLMDKPLREVVMSTVCADHPPRTLEFEAVEAGELLLVVRGYSSETGPGHPPERSLVEDGEILTVELSIKGYGDVTGYDSSILSSVVEPGICLFDPCNALLGGYNCKA